ncbi:unnamed protein product, partial [Closterium sp. NIES-53]
GTVSGGAEPARIESEGALGVPSGAGATGAAGGAAGAGAARAVGGAAGATGGAAGAGAAAGTGAAGASGGAAGAGAAGGATGAAGAAAGAGGAAGAGAAKAAGGAAGSGGAVQPRPYYVPLLQQVLGSPPSPGPPPPLLRPPHVQSQLQLQPASPLPGPSPYSGPTRGLSESRPVSPESCSVLPVCTVRAGRVSRPRPPPVPGTHSMTLRPSTAPHRVPLPSPRASSLPAGPDLASDSLRAASPAVTSFLATAVTDPLFECTAASDLVTELVDYATSLVAGSASASVCPPSVGGEFALGTDVLEEFECFATTLPHLVSMLLALEGDPDAPDIRPRALMQRR